MDPGDVNGGGTKATQLENRVRRDTRNAQDVQGAAREQLRLTTPSGPPIRLPDDDRSYARRRASWQEDRTRTLLAIVEQPFHAMVEVVTTTEPRAGGPRRDSQIWYANAGGRTNEVFGGLCVLAWTHPGIQLALSGKLGDTQDVTRRDIALSSVCPHARARFDRVLPDITGMYEPGGSVRGATTHKPRTGLKAVKLEMTREQVEAFIARMDGVMIVTGAPGTGKTTIALQRLRFLIDQQDELDSRPAVTFEPGSSRVFIANDHLMRYARDLIVKELGLPREVLQSVDELVSGYLEHAWAVTIGARPRQQKLDELERRARAAVFGLTSAEDLRLAWTEYETQIRDRLGTGHGASWMQVLGSSGELRVRGEALAVRLEDCAKGGAQGDPLHSTVRIDAVARGVGEQYQSLRSALAARQREPFDREFTAWLYDVYDPLDALRAYFLERRVEARERVRRGTAGMIQPDAVLGALDAELKARRYGPEHRPWLAWLLRFALPENPQPGARFVEIPRAVPDDPRWTHAVVDEGQDLSAPQASLIASLVDPAGALTVSADFRQTVSPFHGMRDAEAFHVGTTFRERRAEQRFPFGRNMRQSRQIGLFLREFYAKAFGEMADFAPGDRFNDAKPQLLIVSPDQFAVQIAQIVRVWSRAQAIESMAVMQINEDQLEMDALRQGLRREKVSMATAWQTEAASDRLLTTSVERAKGLEFDAVIVLGLDDVERAALEFSTNRAYVALSRPTRRLIMLCREFPTLLRGIPREAFDERKA